MVEIKDGILILAWILMTTTGILSSSLSLSMGVHSLEVANNCMFLPHSKPLPSRVKREYVEPEHTDAVR